MFPPSEIPRVNPETDFDNLEFMTTSSNTGGITDSNYTPTDLQSALSVFSGTNHEFNSGGGYSNNMFEPLLSDIFSSTSSTAVDTPSSQQSDSPMMAEESFPFATRPVDVQPFMASVDDEWFYDYLSSQMAAEPAPAPLPPPAPPLPPIDLLPPNRISPLTCKLGDLNIPMPAMEEIQHYRKANCLSSYVTLTFTINSIPVPVRVPESGARRTRGDVGGEGQAERTDGRSKGVRRALCQDAPGGKLRLRETFHRARRSRA